MPTTRLHRLVRLITLLQSTRARSVPQLTNELGVSRRTLFRDLKALELSGLPYTYTPRAGYRLVQDEMLPPICLTTSETLGLMLLGKDAAARRGWPMAAEALSAINKLTSSVPEPLRSSCSDLMAHVSIDVGGQVDDDHLSKHYETLQRCINEWRICHITYQSPVEPKPLACNLSPYVLHFCARAWYVIGKTDVHKEVRVLKLARIQTTAPTKKLFIRPRRFKAESKIGKAWQLIPEGRLYRIELEFSAKVGTNVAEVRWHPTQQQELLTDGRCRMRFHVDGLTEIAWWICGYADQVIILKPSELRKRVRDMLVHAVANHGKTVPKNGFAPAK